jgi:hypothetical protein
LVDAALERLELQEYVSLQWGFVNGAFTRDEIEAAAEESIQVNPSLAVGVDAAALVKELERRQLLLRFLGPQDDDLYRTRFAETVRLLRYLRQLFPNRDWRNAPSLIADHRLIRKPRLYPRRNISQADVIRHIEVARRLVLDNRTAEAIRKIIGSRQLSQFQQDATARILGTRHQASIQGTIICAGTGTGKTLAFYLPCFAAIVSGLQTNVFETQCLALYPRNELLKDQFQTAFANARLLDGTGERPLRLAVFNGSTPRNASDVSAKWAAPRGQRLAPGYVCPFLRCPDPRCNGDLIWRTADIDRGTEQLFCQACKKIQTTKDTVLLTRDAIESDPPDVLFTTTEMLNRSLSNRKRYKMLGIGGSTNYLRYVLLDEAHTYAGVSGAQNALLLRRWKHLRRQGREQNAPVHFVGLSATLLNPRRFFADLIGEPESAIEAVNADGDLEPLGWEYQLALRGNPAERASLLSTSIQTVMLLARMLDPLRGDLSHGAFPGKVFAFTDDLDVTNRLFHNLKDAEGWSGFRQVRPPLAFERRPTDSGNPWPDIRSREREGQVWDACERINGQNTLNQGLILDRVSSQDAGVNPAAKVVVATASLEVGFDDDAVGAVIQHKAARGAASFLQRKGRAGRKQESHPWTVVVLSDFGRDRIAYQGYDQIFDPELDRTDLPVRNRYVLKMQATFALMDYLQQRIRRQFSDVWSALTYPSTFDWAHQRRAELQQITEAILSDEAERNRFAVYLRKALGLTEDEVQALFWYPPRSLMTAVLPTVIRRLETNFDGERNSDAGKENRNPLPEFVTANLFSNLLTPEVNVRARALNDTVEYEEQMGIVQALGHAVPGRVTRRYALQETQEHWLPPSFSNGAVDLATDYPAVRDLTIAEYLTGTPAAGVPLGQSYVESEDACFYDEAGDPRPVRIHRPQQLDLRRTTERLSQPAMVVSTSRTALNWRTQFHVQPGDNALLVLPARIQWAQWIRRIHFLTFNTANPLRVQRFAVGCEGTLNIRPQTAPNTYGKTEAHRISVRFTETPAVANGDEIADRVPTAGIGFEMEADAIGFECEFPERLLAVILTESKADLRVPYFNHVVRTARSLDGFNRFDREWFAQVALSIYAGVSDAKKLPLEDAVAACSEDDTEAWRRKVDYALRTIFQLAPGHADDEREDDGVADSEADDERGGHTPGRYEQLLENLTTIQVREALTDAAKALFEEPDRGWYPWLRERLRATLGNALLQTCYEVANEFQTAELILDLDAGPPTASDLLTPEAYSEMVWISETIPGSAGVIEQVRRVLLFERERFFQLMGNVLRASRWEALGRHLKRILELQETPGPVREALAKVRAADGIEELNTAREGLFDTLRRHEVTVSHGLVNALNVRILHPASNSETDLLLLDLVREWEAVEERLRTDVDARIFAYMASRHEQLGRRVDAFLKASGNPEPTPGQRFGAIYAMLWPRGYAVRERAFATYNPFAELPTADALLLERAMDAWQTGETVTDVSEASVGRLLAELQRHGAVKLTVPLTERLPLKDVLLKLVATPVETGFLVGYPRIGQTHLTDDAISITLTLPEAQFG